MLFTRKANEGLGWAWLQLTGEQNLHLQRPFGRVLGHNWSTGAAREGHVLRTVEGPSASYLRTDFRRLSCERGNGLVLQCWSSHIGPVGRSFRKINLLACCRENWKTWRGTLPLGGVLKIHTTAHVLEPRLLPWTGSHTSEFCDV